MAQVVFGFGSNVGFAAETIRRAMERVAALCRDWRESSLYSSAPMYQTHQAPFINAVGIGTTEMGPLSLLRSIKNIEVGLGRIARERNGPREIDIDLLAYGALRYRFTREKQNVLEVPHPKMNERRFVLLPLQELTLGNSLPWIGDVDALLRQTESQAQDVSKLNEVLSIHRTR